MSRNPHEPTDETRKQVYSLTARGARQSDIAILIGISEKTLRLHYREQLDDGAADMLAAITKKLLAMMANGNRSAAFFYLKCWGGQQPNTSARAEHAKLVKERDKKAAKVRAKYLETKAAHLSEGCSREQCIETIMYSLRFQYKLNYCDTKEDLTRALKRLLPKLLEEKHDAADSEEE